MKKVTSIEQLQQCIASVRNYRKGFITNFFPDPFRHSLWIEKGELSFGETGESLFLLRENSFFYSLFYVSTTLEALKSDLALFLVKHQGETLVADVVGNQDNVTARQVFLDLGFQQYASLTRMSRINNSPETVYKKNLRIVNGNVADAGVVYELLNQYFDPLAEQLPLLEELEDFAKKGQLIVYKENGEIGGFIIYELQGKTSYLRYWLVHPEFRGKRIGSALFTELLSRSADARRLILWVMDTNHNAVNMYQHFGAEFEMMFNYVLIKRAI